MTILFLSSDQNLLGTANLFFRSMECEYSPMNMLGVYELLIFTNIRILKKFVFRIFVAVLFVIRREKRIALSPTFYHFYILLFYFIPLENICQHN